MKMYARPELDAPMLNGILHFAYLICSSAVCKYLPMMTMMFRRDSFRNKTVRPSLDKPMAPTVSMAIASKLASLDEIQLKMNS